ncbi:MAG: hypothetical protein ACOVNZ_04300 [Crocinitomicaceae bacterium]
MELSFPNKQNVEPRYDQINYDWNDCKNRFLQIVSPNSDDEGTWIYQDAWIHLADISENQTISYQIKKNGNGVYLMNIDGQLCVSDKTLLKRDAIGIWNEEEIQITAQSNSRVLAIEVPMIF